MGSVYELTLAAYRVREDKGPDAASHMYLYGTLEGYEPIANIEHLSLILKAEAGLQWGKLESFSLLVMSGHFIPTRVRELFYDLVDGKCHYGYSIEINMNPKFRGLDHQTPFGQRRILDRNMSVRATYHWEMEHNGKTRNDAKQIRHELAQKYGLSEGTIRTILKKANEEKDQKKLDAIFEGYKKRDLERPT